MKVQEIKSQKEDQHQLPELRNSCLIEHSFDRMIVRDFKHASDNFKKIRKDDHKSVWIPGITFVVSIVMTIAALSFVLAGIFFGIASIMS